MSGPEFIGDIIEKPSQARAKLILIVESRTKWAFYKKVQNEYIRLDPPTNFVFLDRERNLTAVVDNCQVIVYKGPSPERGCPGTPGPRGFPGNPGLDGVPGTSGSNGNPGIPGSPGKQGLIGLEGEQGFRGLKGVSGKSGLSGRPGLNGAIRRGPRGAPGAEGSRGNRGLSGDQGLVGSPGDTGLTGSPGAPGPSGYPGLPGSLGVRGPRGISGKSGPSGVQGPSGMSGLAGLPGQNGLSGLPGLSGISGFPGLSGISGSPGLSGISGPSGFPGPSGNSGSSGEKGSPGAPGTPGQIGDRGLPGHPGQDGHPGRNGNPAPPGEPGIPGKIGAPGNPGAPGEPGRNGIQGDQGLRGAPGTTLNGVPGTNGLSGRNGIPGSPGTMGPSGPSGPPGIMGPSGSRGAPGNSPSGPSGPPGMSAGREFAFGYVWSKLISGSNGQVLNPYISNSFPAPVGTTVNFDESILDNLSFNGNSLTIQEDGYYQARYVVNPINPFDQPPAAFPSLNRNYIFTNGENIVVYSFEAGSSIYICSELEASYNNPTDYNQITSITDNGYPSPNNYIKATSYLNADQTLNNEIWYADNINLNVDADQFQPLHITITTSNEEAFSFFNIINIVGTDRTNSLGSIAPPYSGTISSTDVTNVTVSFTPTGQGELGLMSVASTSSDSIDGFTATTTSTVILNSETSSDSHYGGLSALGDLDTSPVLSVTPRFFSQNKSYEITAIGVSVLAQTISNEPDLLSFQLLKNGQPIPGSRTFKNLITSPTPIVGATAHSANNAGISGNVGPVTVSISPNEGSSLYVAIQAVGDSLYDGNIESVSDGINTYRQAQNTIQFSDVLFIQNTIWYADNIQTNGSFLNVTVSFSVPTEIYVELVEIIGANKTNSFDSASQFYESGITSPQPVIITVPNNFSNELGLVSVLGYGFENPSPFSPPAPITSITSLASSGHVINQIYNTEATTESNYFGLANFWGNLNENSNFSVVFNPNSNINSASYSIFGISIIPESSQYENIGQLVGGAIFEANSGDVIQLANNRIENTYLEGYILSIPVVVNSATEYSSSKTLDVTLNVTRGNSLYVCIETYDLDILPSISTLHDTQNNSYKLALIEQQSIPQGGGTIINLSVFIYYFDNLNTTGSLTIEITFSNSVANSGIQVFEISGADPSGSLDGTISTYGEYSSGSSLELTPSSTSSYDLGLISIGFASETPSSLPNNGNYINPNPNIMFLNSEPQNASLLTSGYGNLSSSTLGGIVWIQNGADADLGLVAGAVSIKPAPINNLNNASLELVLLP